MAKKSKEEEQAEIAAMKAELEKAEAEGVLAKEEAEEEEAEEGADGEEAPHKKRKEKKAVKKRRSKKEKENPLARALRLAVETGKVEFGAKTGMKDSLLGKAKLIIVSSNAPRTLQEDISYYSKLSEIPVLIFDGTSVELGSICGKPYSVSVLSVYEEGSSGIMELAKKK